MAEDKLIYAAEDGSLSFGDCGLPVKKKQEVSIDGDQYKVKTFREITKLEKNEGFVYESVPGTDVSDFRETESGVTFTVRGDEDAQIILGLADNAEYTVFVDGRNIGRVSTGLGGKLSVSLELAGADSVKVEVTR